MDEHIHSIIAGFVDNGVEWLDEKGILTRPDPRMPQEMIDETKGKKEDWTHWRAIKSTVTENDLLSLENEVGLRLPLSYKEFLKYKHFYSVHSINGFEPFEHIIYHWKETLQKKWFHPELKEYLLDQGFIWFGNHEDWGFLCFDANKSALENEYPIILIDHETIEAHQPRYKNFLGCLEENTFRK